MHNQTASSNVLRVCAWCGTALDAPTGRFSASWSRIADSAPASQTHTICNACLITFFADDIAGSDHASLQPVAVRRG